MLRGARLSKWHSKRVLINSDSQLNFIRKGKYHRPSAVYAKLLFPVNILQCVLYMALFFYHIQKLHLSIKHDFG